MSEPKPKQNKNKNQNHKRSLKETPFANSAAVLFKGNQVLPTYRTLRNLLLLASTLHPTPPIAQVTSGSTESPATTATTMGIGKLDFNSPPRESNVARTTAVALAVNVVEWPPKKQ